MQHAKYKIQIDMLTVEVDIFNLIICIETRLGEVAYWETEEDTR